MKNENDNIDDMNWYPKTKPKTFLLYLLASPVLACGFWLVLLYLCVKES